MDKNLYSPPKSKVSDLTTKTRLNLPASLLLGILTSGITCLIATFGILITIVPSIFYLDENISDAVIEAQLMGHPMFKLFSVIFLLSVSISGSWLTTKLSGRNWKKIGLFYALLFCSLILLNGFIGSSSIAINSTLAFALLVIFLSAFLGAYLGRWKNTNLM